MPRLSSVAQQVRRLRGPGWAVCVGGFDPASPPVRAANEVSGRRGVGGGGPGSGLASCCPTQQMDTVLGTSGRGTAAHAAPRRSHRKCMSPSMGVCVFSTAL